MTEEEIIDYIYLIMGITEEDIPREVVTAFYTIRKAAQPDLDDCLIIYYTILDCYTWLIRNSIANGGLAGARVREREGGLEYEEQQGQNKSYADYWQDQRDEFEKNPNLPCLDSVSTRGKLIIGGVRVDEHTRVISDTNSLGNGYSIGNCKTKYYSRSTNPFRF